MFLAVPTNGRGLGACQLALCAFLHSSSSSIGKLSFACLRLDPDSDHSFVGLLSKLSQTQDTKAEQTLNGHSRAAQRPHSPWCHRPGHQEWESLDRQRSAETRRTPPNSGPDQHISCEAPTHGRKMDTDLVSPPCCDSGRFAGLLGMQLLAL